MSAFSWAITERARRKTVEFSKASGRSKKGEGKEKSASLKQFMIDKGNDRTRPKDRRDFGKRIVVDFQRFPF